MLLWLAGGLFRAAWARRSVSARERAVQLLLTVLSDPTVEYSRLRRAWPDVRADPLLREGAYLLERLRHPALDRLDQSWVELEIPKINDLIERLQAADADG